MVLFTRDIIMRQKDQRCRWQKRHENGTYKRSLRSRRLFLNWRYEPATHPHLLGPDIDVIPQSLIDDVTSEAAVVTFRHEAAKNHPTENKQRNRYTTVKEESLSDEDKPRAFQ